MSIEQVKHEELLARVHAVAQEGLTGVTADEKDGVVRVARVSLATEPNTQVWALRYAYGVWCNAYSGAPIGPEGVDPLYVTEGMAVAEIINAISEMRAVNESC